MEALVLERKDELTLRELPLQETPGPRDVRIALHTVGVCGSDLHYYTHGGIGPFIVREPMILGHEAAGTVIETGAEVKANRVWIGGRDQGSSGTVKVTGSGSTLTVTGDSSAIVVGAQGTGTLEVLDGGPAARASAAEADDA